MKGIAQRRKDKVRIKEKFRKIVKSWDLSNGDDEWVEKFVARHAENFPCCSCWICGSPRRHGKGKDRLTRQEKIFYRK